MQEAQTRLDDATKREQQLKRIEQELQVREDAHCNLSRQFDREWREKEAALKERITALNRTTAELGQKAAELDRKAAALDETVAAQNIYMEERERELVLHLAPDINVDTVCTRLSQRKAMAQHQAPKARHLETYKQ